MSTQVNVEQDKSGAYAITITMEGAEARGTLILREGAYGFDVLCPDVSEHPLALLDLFYASPSGGDPESSKAGLPLQIVVNSPEQTEDALAFAQFWPDGTLVDFEFGAEVISGRVGAMRISANDMLSIVVGFPPDDR